MISCSFISFQSLLCFDTNQVVAGLWWAFVISCHDWIQMVLGCFLSYLWQPSEVLHDGGSLWGATMFLSMTQKVTHILTTSFAHNTLWTVTRLLVIAVLGIKCLYKCLWNFQKLGQRFLKENRRKVHKQRHVYVDIWIQMKFVRSHI